MYEDNPDPPNSIQLEPTEGCNFACSFCGIHAVGRQSGKLGYRFMDPRVAESVAYQLNELGWNPRVEFAMHGEPTLNPQLAELIEPFRSWPTLVTSNGTGLLKDTRARIQALFDAGLNTLALDDYQTSNNVQNILKHLSGTTATWPIGHYPRDRQNNPHKRRKGQLMVIVEDLTTASNGTHSRVHNSAGNSGPLDFSREGQRCTRPFRSLSIRWDGNVSLCCESWDGNFKLGNVTKEGLYEIWTAPAMQAARRFLYRGERSSIPTCTGCNVPSYRSGLLPDHKGVEDLPRPDVDDHLAIAEACAGEPYTPKVFPLLPRVR